MSIFITLRDLGLPFDEQINLCMLIKQYRKGEVLSMISGIYDSTCNTSPMERLRDRGYITYEEHEVNVDGFDLTIPTIHLTDAAISLIKGDIYTEDFVRYIHSKCGGDNFDFHTRNNKHIGFKIMCYDINPDWFIELDDYRSCSLSDVYGLPIWNINGVHYRLDRISVDGFREPYIGRQWELLNEGNGDMFVYAILMKV